VRPGVLFVGNFLSSHARKRGVSEDLADRLEQRGWTVLRTSSRVSRPLRLMDMVAVACLKGRCFKVAHIDVYSGPAFLWAEAVATVLRGMKQPYILTLHGGALPEFAERWPARVLRLISSASAVTAPSAFLARRMARFRRILIVPNALELRSYPPRRSHGDLNPKLVWLRSFHAIYNPRMAVEVLALLHRDYPGAELTMIGPDDGDGSLESTRQRAEELGVAASVRFTGPVPKYEVPLWLAEGTVFLNTTNIDNAPVSVVEAMASGLPVVSTNVGGISDLVDDEQTGLLVPAGDSPAMAGRIREVLRSPALSERLSASAKQRAALHDWSQVLPRWEELFHSIAIASRQ
jgi:glycosyltransferase involved in cell wall biosynthesis